MKEFAKGIYLKKKQTPKGEVLELALAQADGTYLKYSCWESKNIDKYGYTTFSVYENNYVKLEGNNSVKPKEDLPF